MGKSLYEMLNSFKYDYIDYRSFVMDENMKKSEVSWGLFECNKDKYNEDDIIYNGRNDGLPLREEVIRFEEKFVDDGKTNTAILIVWQADECEAPSIIFNE